MSLELNTLVHQVGQKLKLHGQHLTTAESCTGGGVSYWLTSVSGSSEWFERGFVTYSNDAKIEMLNVDPIILKQYGAVSEQTAIAMAEGALKNSYATISVAITGIAGPEGGTSEKPVGTVWIAWAKRHGNTIANFFTFSGDRQSVRDQAIHHALEKLLDILP